MRRRTYVQSESWHSDMAWRRGNHGQRKEGYRGVREATLCAEGVVKDVRRLCLSVPRQSAHISRGETTGKTHRLDDARIAWRDLRVADVVPFFAAADVGSAAESSVNRRATHRLRATGDSLMATAKVAVVVRHAEEIVDVAIRRARVDGLAHLVNERRRQEGVQVEAGERVLHLRLELRSGLRQFWRANERHGTHLVAERPVKGKTLEVDDEDGRKLRQRELLDRLAILLAARTVPAKDRRQLGKLDRELSPRTKHHPCPAPRRERTPRDKP